MDMHLHAMRDVTTHTADMTSSWQSTSPVTPGRPGRTVCHHNVTTVTTHVAGAQIRSGPHVTDPHDRPCRASACACRR
eukprot:2271632-Prymnesium_polylepis.2